MLGETFDPFEVVVVPFPFTDKAGRKRRPALVVSRRTFNDRHGHVVLAMITSARHEPWASDVRVESWRDARLTAPCMVRFKLFTLDVSLILGRVGLLSDPDRSAVQAMLAQNLAFA